MNIVFLGPPASGKGTQSGALKDYYHIPHISTGDMFRQAILDGSPAGKIAQQFIDDGKFVPDDITIDIVKERLSQPDCAKGYILDGFPRTIAQAKALEQIGAELNRPVQAVINLHIRTEELIRRMSGRRVCTKCRAIYHVDNLPPQVAGVCDVCGGPLILRKDDNLESLKVRLDYYERETKPLIDFYRDMDLLFDIDGEEAIERVFRRIRKHMEPFA